MIVCIMVKWPWYPAIIKIQNYLYSPENNSSIVSRHREPNYVIIARTTEEEYTYMKLAFDATITDITEEYENPLVGKDSELGYIIKSNELFE